MQKVMAVRNIPTNGFKSPLHCSSIVLNFERAKAGHRDEHWSSRMSAAERINLQMQQLPQLLQIEETESIQFNADTPRTQRIAKMNLPVSAWNQMEQEIEAEHLKKGRLQQTQIK